MCPSCPNHLQFNQSLVGKIDRLNEYSYESVKFNSFEVQVQCMI